MYSTDEIPASMAIRAAKLLSPTQAKLVKRWATEQAAGLHTSCPGGRRTRRALEAKGLLETERTAGTATRLTPLGLAAANFLNAHG